VFIKVVDETSAVNPSNGTVAVKLVKDASGKVTLRYTNSDAAAVAYTGTVTITNTTNGYVTTVDLVGGKFTASTTSFTDAETIAVSSNSAVKRASAPPGASTPRSSCAPATAATTSPPES